MAYDMENFRNLSAEQQAEELKRQESEKDKTFQEWQSIEKKLRNALNDDGSKHSELSPLISFREELKQLHHHAHADYMMVKNFLERSGGGFTGQAAAGNLPSVGAGTVSIRVSDQKPVKPDHVPDLGEILAKEQKQREEEELRKLEKSLASILNTQKPAAVKQSSQAGMQTQS